MKTLQEGATLLREGLLYELGPVGRVAVGIQKVGKIPDLLAKYPSLREGSGLVKVDTDPDRANQVRLFWYAHRPATEDSAIDSARKAEHHYKKSFLFEGADADYLDPPSFAEAVEAQVAVLLAIPKATPAFKRFVRIAADALLERFAGQTLWVLRGRLIPYPPMNEEGTGMTIPGAPHAAKAAVESLLALNPSVEG